MEAKLTKEIINDIFGKEVVLPSATDEVSYHYRSEGDWLLVYKQFQGTISIFEDTNEFVCILRDYGVRTKEKLLKVLQSSSMNILPKEINFKGLTSAKEVYEEYGKPNPYDQAINVVGGKIEYGDKFVTFTYEDGKRESVSWGVFLFFYPNADKEALLKRTPHPDNINNTIEYLEKTGTIDKIKNK